MSNILDQQQQDLQKQLEELVKVGVGGKFKDTSDYTKRIQEELEFETEQRTLDRQKRLEVYKKMRQSLKERYNCTDEPETYSDEKPLFNEHSPPSESCCAKFFKYFI